MLNITLFDKVMSEHLSAILIVSILLIQPKYSQEFSSNNLSLRNKEESDYLIVWGEKCLSQFDEEILEDSENPDRNYEYQGESNEYLKDLKKKEFLLYLDVFKNVDISPFFEAVMGNKPISPTDMNFRGFLIFAIVFIVIGFITCFSFCICTFSKISKKKMKRRNCLLQTCFAIPCIFIMIGVFMTISNYLYLSEMMEIENNLLCEATRIPHTLFFGNPENHLDVENSRHFVGFESIRNYIQNFLVESNSFQNGENSVLIKDLQDIDILKSVHELFEKSQEFFSYFESKMIVNASGERQHPLTIVYNLPSYKNYLTQMLDRYQIGGDRLENIVTLSPTLLDSEDSSYLVSNLKNSHDQLLKIQQHLSIFWNQMLTASFDNTLVFKIAVIGVIMQNTVLILSILLMASILGYSTCKFANIKNKKALRFLMILVCLICIITTISLYEVARGVFSSVYGCSVMYQMKENPVITNSKIKNYVKSDVIISNIFDKCFSDDSTDHTQNFYSLFEDEQVKTSIQEFLEFLDGIKMLHEEVKFMDSNYDTKLTESMAATFQAYKDGELYDFEDIEHKISQLNQYFECAHIFFSLSQKGCEKKTKCINIKQDEFESPQCVSYIIEAKQIFDNLHAYIMAEDQLMEEILFKLNSPKNPKSLLNLINKILMEFEQINSKVKNLDSKLDTHFDQLADGAIHTWLDCGVVKDQIKKSFNNLCDSKVEDLTNFVNLNIAIILISFFSLIIFFILSFCFDEQGQQSHQKPKQKHDYLNMSSVMDQSKFDHNNTNEHIQGQFTDKPTRKQTQFHQIGL